MIYLLCSTIRPKVFRSTHAEWVAKAHHPSNFRTKLVVDSRYDLEELSDFDCTLYTGETTGLTKPLTLLTQSLTDLNDTDIIVVMSDDFFPPKNWDLFLIEQFKDFDGALSVYDGGPKEVQNTIITIPIMAYSCLKKLNGIVYHPAYNHMFSDNELFDNLIELNALKWTDKAPEHTFEHRHWTRGSRKRDSHDDVLGGCKVWNQDQSTYLSRKKLPLIEKLKYTPLNTPLLTIMICTMDERKRLLDRLLSVITPQLSDSVQLLICKDAADQTHTPHKRPSIGRKRNSILKRATGKYVCFIDDDDLISPDYISTMLRACEYNTDCIGLSGLVTTNGGNPKFFSHSLKYNKWEENNGIYQRFPNHLNPIKRSIAQMVGFDETRTHGEDRDFSERVFPLLKTEYYVPNIVYIYLVNSIKI
jgi:hypothetical protein